MFGGLTHAPAVELAQRLAARGVTLEVDAAARTWLADRGYDPVYGARPLRRLVQKEIGDRLATALLAGEVRDGQEVTVDVEGEGKDAVFTFAGTHKPDVDDVAVAVGTGEAGPAPQG